MNVIAFILFIVAAALFLVGERLTARVASINLGLAVLTVGFIVQLSAEKHTITF